MPSPVPEPNEIGQVCPTNEKGTLSLLKNVTVLFKIVSEMTYEILFPLAVTPCPFVIFFSVINFYMLLFVLLRMDVVLL